MAAKLTNNRSGAGLLLVAILVIAVVALTRVLSIRYDAGESYPAYSSLRADPLGTRVLFEAINKQPGVKATRQFGPLQKVEGHPGSALLLCGIDAESFNSWDDDENNRILARFAAGGGRLIIAIDPASNMGRMGRAYRNAKDELDEERKKDRQKKKSEQPKKQEKKELSEKPAKPKEEPKPTGQVPKDETKPEPAKGKKDKEDEVKASHRMSSLASNLKISANSREFFYRGKEGSPLSPVTNGHLSAEDLPSWYSNVFLNDDQGQDWKEIEDAKKPEKMDVKKPAAKSQPPEVSPWHAVAIKGDRNMIMERRLGAGSVVVCTDRYFLSNEALWKEPKEKFLSWLFGDSTQIIFEETHLGPGVGETDGVMTLARRYGMHGLFLGGILLFGLYIWRNAISLVPSNPDDDLGLWRADAVAGQSTASGLEGLLRRGVSPSKLLEKCLETWAGTRAASGAVSQDRLAKARGILQGVTGWRQAPQAYADIRDALHSRQPSTTPSHAPTDTP